MGRQPMRDSKGSPRICLDSNLVKGFSGRVRCRLLKEEIKWIPIGSMEYSWGKGPFQASTWLEPLMEYAVPDPFTEDRRKRDLSSVVGMPWKPSKNHDGDKEVFLDENPAEPSSSPMVSPLPPIITEEPIERIRIFYVTAKDVDPNSGGLGFTDGCKGCRAIINRRNPVAHSPECRLKVMEQA